MRLLIDDQVLRVKVKVLGKHIRLLDGPSREYVVNPRACYSKALRHINDREVPLRHFLFDFINVKFQHERILTLKLFDVKKNNYKDLPGRKLP